MSHSEPTPTVEPKTLGLLAEFAGPDELVAAAAKATEAGVRKIDAYSPFPIHGIDDALRSKKTILPWLVFCCGLSGCILALALQYYVNGVEGGWKFSGYEYNISAKPMFSLPANIPVTFEVIILLSSFGAFFGMLILNGLPRLSNPLFKNERFQEATSHRFFLWVDAKDEKFDGAETLMQSLGASAVDSIQDETTGQAVPSFLYAVGVVGASLALIPPLWIAAASGISNQPRLSIWWDMDYQPKFKAQTFNGNFENRMSMRKPIAGTVARGSLTESIEYYRGIKKGGELTADVKKTAAMFVNLQAADGAGDTGTDGAAAEPPEPDWVTEFPLPITDKLMARGQQRFNIYCSACHGQAGDGDGLVARRALGLQQGTWVQPSNLHTDYILKQPPGKLYNTIANGIRKMSGYSTQLSVKDRWAIALYVKALQRGRNASLEDVPEAMREKIQ